MRLRVALGALTVAAGLLAACEEAGRDPYAAAGAAGTSITAGAGGDGSDAGATVPGGGAAGCGSTGDSSMCSAATAGTTGSAGDAGTASNSASNASDAGTAATTDASTSPSEPCTGCLELRASVTNDADSAFFQIVYDTPVDMSQAGATITFRVSGLAPEHQVRITPFIYDSDYTFAPGDTSELVAGDGFVDLVLELDELTSGALDKSDVIYVGLFVGYTGGIGAESSQDLALLLDSITFSGADTPDLAFATDNESFGRSEIGVQATEVLQR